MSFVRALVTGASRGIGLEVARALAPTHELVLVARSIETLASELAQLRGPGAPPRLVACDLADETARRKLIGEIADAEIRVLVNNAGIAESAPLERTSDDVWARMIAINLTAPFELCRALVPGMANAGFGRVINIASTAALRGYRYAAAYSATKAGLLGLTRSLALEVATKGVTVNAVCPGFTDTTITDDAVRNIVGKTGQSREEARRALAAFSPQKRLMTPEEVAALVAYLVGANARGINGQALPIDGGETA
jgi:NAD(P)-dependent dehydrogenase (short-subunit alcohol dehydrogenase family)